jgi:general secretion pathway protein M
VNLPLERLPDGVRGRILALGLLAVLLALLWTAVISPLFDWYAARAETIAERRGILAHATGLAETLPALRQAAGRVGAGPPKTALLDGKSDAIAAAGLQGMVQDMAATAGISLASAETLPGEPCGSYRRIGVRIAFVADWPVFVVLLQAIETNRIRLLVDDLQLHAVAQVGPNGPIAASPRIDTSLIVLGFRTAPGAPSTPVSTGRVAEAGR